MTTIEKLKKAFKYSVYLSCFYFVGFLILFILLGNVLFALPIALVLSCIFWAITFVVILSILDSKNRKNIKKNIEPKKELTPYEYKVKVSKSNIIKIKKTCDFINNSDLKKEVDEFIIKSNRILNICSEENEKELDSFFTFCIPTVLELVEEFSKYITLGINTEEAENFKRKVIQSIDEINDRITSIENTFVKRTTERIDVNVKTLNTILELEGYDAVTDEKE